MKVQAAAITRNGQAMVIVLVPLALAGNSGEADMAIERLQPAFGAAPVVLMAQKDDGSPVYYGPGDRIALLEDVPVEKMPWKSYDVGG